jgi:hypothetical protein
MYSPAHIFDVSQGRDLPKDFFSDDDYFIPTTAADPQVDWFSQGWWGNPSGEAHCNITGSLVGKLNFPAELTVTEFGNNNAAAILQPDNDTLVLTQPLYVCTPGAPVLSILDKQHGTTSIRGNGTWGGHGGSSLSAIGGTIRKGELLPGSGPITHALKLELFAHEYYYSQPPGYVWPALNCDGYAFDCKGNSFGCYGGNNSLLSPGALLAVPPNVSSLVAAQMKTQPGKSILWTLTNFGGYLVDDTYWYRGTICTEHGVTDEFQAAWGFPFNANPGDMFFDDLLLIFQSLAVVANNGPNTIGGGGAPLQPLAPPFCNYTESDSS